jgi:predicted O-methyltransferase YrrM
VGSRRAIGTRTFPTPEYFQTSTYMRRNYFLLRCCLSLFFGPLPSFTCRIPHHRVSQISHKLTMSDTTSCEAGESLAPEVKGDEHTKKIQPFWERRGKLIGEGPLEEAKAMLLDDDAERYYEEEALIMIKAIKASMALANGGDAGRDGDASMHTAVELGSGCGRITTRLAPLVKDRLHAVELVEEFAKRCEANCLALGLRNVVVHNKDACTFEWPAELDLVLFKWVLMYVSDEQAVALIERACENLKPGGVIVLQECCSRTGYLRWSDVSWSDDPVELDDYAANYRPLSWYLDKLDATGKGRVVQESYELDETVFVDYYKLYPKDPNCQPIITWVKG